MDVFTLSFNALLLLEPFQFGWPIGYPRLPHDCAALAHGYQWARFYKGGEAEPVRKYWKVR
jgi:hypothetical protein